MLTSIIYLTSSNICQEVIGKYWYAKANKISFRGCASFEVDGISIGEAEITYFFDLSNEFFDEVESKWSKIVEQFVI